MRILVGISAAVLLVVGFWSEMSRSEDPLTTATIASANFAKQLAITKADWQHGGIGGSVAVAEIGVRNNADYPIRIDAITCRFRLPGQKDEERTASTYEVMPAQGTRTIRNLGFGFIDADLKSECRISKAQKA
jgi:hypothetical protein